MIQLPLEQAQALRAYLGTRPYDEVAAACVWLDAAIRAAQSAGASLLDQMQAAALRADHESAQRAEAEYGGLIQRSVSQYRGAPKSPDSDLVLRTPQPQESTDAR